MDIRKFINVDKKNKVVLNPTSSSNSVNNSGDKITVNQTTNTEINQSPAPVIIEFGATEQAFASVKTAIATVKENQEVSSSRSINSSGENLPKPKDAEQPLPKRRKTDQDFPWILRKSDGFYCGICVKHGQSNSSSNGVWVNQPFTRSRDLYERAKKHNDSQCHKFSSEKDKSARAAEDGNISVIKQVKSFKADQEIGDKQVMLTFFDAAYFLFKNEISYTTIWNSLLSLLNRSDFSLRINNFQKSRPKNASYTSTDSITGILHAISEVIQRKIFCNLGNSVQTFSYFTLMADEATTQRNETVLSICARF